MLTDCQNIPFQSNALSLITIVLKFDVHSRNHNYRNTDTKSGGFNHRCVTIATFSGPLLPHFLSQIPLFQQSKDTSQIHVFHRPLYWKTAVSLFYQAKVQILL